MPTARPGPEFFRTPPPPTLYEQMGEAALTQHDVARSAIEDQSRSLIAPVAHLVEQLVASRVPASATLVVYDEDLSTPKRPGKTIVGRGWVISRTMTPWGERAITLIDDGNEGLLLVGQTLETDKSTDHRTVLLGGPNQYGHDAQASSAIDLEHYPCHPWFQTEKGYRDTTNKTAELSRIPSPPPGRRPAADPPTAPVPRGSIEANVAINIEKLEYDLQTSGRELLGIT